MEKQKVLSQFKSYKLWKDSVITGLAIFGVVSALAGIIGVSFSDISDDMWIVLGVTIVSLAVTYLIALIWEWWHIKNSITLKIRGIKVTIRQGDIFQEHGWKVIGVDDTFSTSEDDRVVSHSSLHGKLLQQLRKNNKINEFEAAIAKDQHEVSLGCVKTYNDFILLAWSHFDSNGEAHIDNANFESILRKMWQEIGRVYSGKPVCLPILGDGITRFDGTAEKPTPSGLIKCMLCTLKTSNIQLKAPITIVVYDRINEISFYNLKELSIL